MYFPGKNRLYIFRERRLACFTKPLHAARPAAWLPGWQPPRRRAAPGPAEARRAGSGSADPARRPLSSAGSPRERGRAALPGSSRRRRPLLGPGWSPDGAAWRGCSRPSRAPAGRAGLRRAWPPRRLGRGGGGTPRASAGPDEQGREALAGRRPLVLPRSGPPRAAAGPPPRCGSPLPPRVPPPQGSPPGAAPPAPVVSFPSSRQSRGAPSPAWGGPLCTARPAPGRGSRRGPAMPPPPPLLKLRGKSPPAGRAPALPCRAFPRRAGIREEEKHIYRIGIFFSLNSTSS